MGSSNSKAKIREQVTSSLGVDLVNQIESSCKLAVDAHQKIAFGNVTGGEISGISQTIDPGTATSSCEISAALNAIQGTDASQELVSSLQQAQLSGGLGAFSSSTLDAMKNLTSESDIKLKNKVINECQSAVDISQSFEVGNITDAKINNIYQVNKTFNDCIMEGLGDTVQQAKTDQTTSSETEVKQETDTGLKLNEIVGSFTDLLGTGLMIPLLIGGVVLFFVYMTFGSGVSAVAGSAAGVAGGEAAASTGSKLGLLGKAIVVIVLVAALLMAWSILNAKSESIETETVVVEEDDTSKAIAENANVSKVETEAKSNSNLTNSSGNVYASNEETVNATNAETPKEGFHGNVDTYYNFV